MAEAPPPPSWKELLDAVRAGETAKVGRWLRRHPELATAREPGGVSALLVAVYHHHEELRELLAAALTALDVHEAAACGRAERVRELVDADPALVDAVGADGFRPLGLAAFFGHVGVVDVLLERGADAAVPSENAMRVTPLHSAVARRDPDAALDLARRLLARGADPDAAQAGGWTPLHQAAAHGHRPLVDLLLAHGADPTAESDNGKTPADMATDRGHPELANRLRR